MSAIAVYKPLRFTMHTQSKLEPHVALSACIPKIEILLISADWCAGMLPPSWSAMSNISAITLQFNNVTGASSDTLSLDTHVSLFSAFRWRTLLLVAAH